MRRERGLMNLVIIGAGDIGLHIAKIFSQFEYGVVLVDTDPHKLEMAARDLDITTRLGSGTDWELLEELLEFSPDLLIAVTNNDETNLVACTCAKNLGYHQTIARVRNPQYLMQSRLHFERLFCVDYLISPEKLTADALANMIVIPDALATGSFAHGAVSMQTMKIPSSWQHKHTPLKRRNDLGLPDQTMVALIRREGHLIFPHGDDSLYPEDEVTFIGESQAIGKIASLLKIPLVAPRSVVIVGGSLVGIHLAKALQEASITTVILEKDPLKCQKLAQMLPNANVIHHDGTDYKFLQTEKICPSDVFVACTRLDEVNFLAASVARDLGSSHVMISLSNTHYLPLLARLGISQAASPQLHSTNRIFSIVREKQVASMISMYDTKAEVMEVKVSMNSKITGIPIKYLGPELPKDFLIAVIQSRGRVFIADGSRILSPGDTVIVISSPHHMKEIKKLF